MQRYLQYNELTKRGLQHFDAWASTFGETVTAIELAPEGVLC
jgi:N12 class adenine-specific DNA methylase